MKRIFKFSLVFLFLVIILIVVSLCFYKNHIIKNSYNQNNGDYVVLLHGLGRTSLSMQNLGVKLAKNGYKVININYPSRSDSIENLVDNYLKKELSEKCTDKNKKINFVAHSMGGIMIRYLLDNNEIPNVNKIIMLAPPNQGSSMADKWSTTKVGNYIMGPALKELTTNENSFVNNLPDLDYEIGIIAGKYDRKVSTEKTKLDEMADFEIVSKTHTWIMNSDKVINLILNFLSQGKFNVV